MATKEASGGDPGLARQERPASVETNMPLPSVPIAAKPERPKSDASARSVNSRRWSKPFTSGCQLTPPSLETCRFSKETTVKTAALPCVSSAISSALMTSCGLWAHAKVAGKYSAIRQRAIDSGRISELPSHGHSVGLVEVVQFPAEHVEGIDNQAGTLGCAEFDFQMVMPMGKPVDNEEVDHGRGLTVGRVYGRLQLAIDVDAS